MLIGMILGMGMALWQLLFFFLYGRVTERLPTPGFEPGVTQLGIANFVEAFASQLSSPLVFGFQFVVFVLLMALLFRRDRVAFVIGGFVFAAALAFLAVVLYSTGSTLGYGRLDHDCSLSLGTADDAGIDLLCPPVHSISGDGKPHLVVRHRLPARFNHFHSDSRLCFSRQPGGPAASARKVPGRELSCSSLKVDGHPNLCACPRIVELTGQDAKV